MGKMPAKAVSAARRMSKSPKTPTSTSSASATTSSASATFLPPALQKANASHYVLVENAIAAITADDILGVVLVAAPLTLAEGGRSVLCLACAF